MSHLELKSGISVFMYLRPYKINMSLWIRKVSINVLMGLWIGKVSINVLMGLWIGKVSINGSQS